MNEGPATAVFVLARLSFSKGDLYLIETVREFPDEASAREWMETDEAAEGSWSGWPDWHEHRVLRQSGERYFDVSGQPIVTIQEM